MVCARCGTECLPEHKFCKSCGAALTGPVNHQEVPVIVPVPVAVPVAVPIAVPMPTPPVQSGQSGAIPGAPAAVLFQGVSPQVYAASAQAAAQLHRIQQTKLMHGLRGRIQSLASTETLEGFSLREMFSQVFKRHSAGVIEDYIMVGTTKTTPPIDVVETGWPQPWLFFRLLIALVLAYVALTVLFMQTGNSNCVPGMMFLGAFAVPVSTMMLFFELNTPRNVSLHMVGKLFLAGAVVSLTVALLIYSFPIFDISEMEAGVVEEVAKLLTVIIVMRSVRYKYILNGVLFGATVGAGFAAFETAGYALNQAFLPGYLAAIVHAGSLSAAAKAAAMHQGVIDMLQILRVRAILAPLGHVAWTALAAGAFWRVKQGKPTSIGMLFNGRFLKAFMIPVVMHAIWDAPWQLPFDGNMILTGLVSWYVVFGLVQQGLRQVKEEQKAHLQSTLDSVEASLQAPAPAIA